jgi:hypothetical protein
MWHKPYPDKDPLLTMTDTQLYDSINLLERTLVSNACSGQTVGRNDGP